MLSLIAGRVSVQQVPQVRGMLNAASAQSNPLNFGALGRIDLGIVDLAENEASQGVFKKFPDFWAQGVIPFWASASSPLVGED